MGFASIAMYTGMFMIVMLIVLGIGANYKDYVEKTEDMIDVGFDNPEINIINTSYLDNITTIWAENDGQDAIRTTDIDVYLSGNFIPRNSTGRIVSIPVDPRNPGLLDPGEEAKIEIDMQLELGNQIVKISAGGEPDTTNVTVGTEYNETLANTAGEWTPPGNAFTAGELLAINNQAGTNITLNSTNSSIGIDVSGTTHTPYSVSSVEIKVDYYAPQILDGELTVSGMDSNYQGTEICSGTYGNTGQATLVCAPTPGQLQNLYIVINSTSLSDVVIDWIRTNASYIG